MQPRHEGHIRVGGMDVTFVEELDSNINDQIAPPAQQGTGSHQICAEK